MKSEPIKLCWRDLGEGKVCERLAGHPPPCSPDPKAEFPIEVWPSWTCPHCGAKSYNPEDVEKHYCGRCHHFCDDV